MSTPTHSRYIIIGAGIHGLSTAWGLARELQERGLGSGADVLVLDKHGIAAGASGIACGVVRNNYFQPAMRELMAHSVGVWESEPSAFAYNPVGYLQISHEGMRDDVGSIHAQQEAIGYESAFIEGQAESDAYMKGIFSDWTAQGITSVLHEKRGGYAHNSKAIYGLAGKAEALGVRIMTGMEVHGFIRDNGSEAVSAVETSKGTITCEQVIIAVGPWVRTLWDALDLPVTITVRGRDGVEHHDVPMWTYWALEEGVIKVEPGLGYTNDGKLPPVVHVDTDVPLKSDVDGSVITDQPWGIYYKPDAHFGGIQGGAMPYIVDKAAEDVAVDPYGPSSPDFVVGDDFAHMWCSALAFCQERYKGKIARYDREPSGGIGCFTPDSFPVFDRFAENVTILADSNHGYKMIGVGQLTALEVLGERQSLLEPFRFSRYASGNLHPTSNSPFPWS